MDGKILNKGFFPFHEERKKYSLIVWLEMLIRPRFKKLWVVNGLANFDKIFLIKRPAKENGHVAHCVVVFSLSLLHQVASLNRDVSE